MKIVSQVKLTEEEIARLKSVSPDVEIKIAGYDFKNAAKEIVNADIFFGRIPCEVFREGKQLKWVQVFGAGVETCMFPEMVESDVILTNTSGAFNNVMADHAFGLILSISRGIANFVKNQLQRKWSRDGVYHQLSGQTLGIIGLGNIGCEIARRSQAFGMKIAAADIRTMECPVFVNELWGMDDKEEVIKQSDYLLIVVPLTPETRGLIGAEDIKMMKPTAHLINIGRGPVVDEKALIAALKDGTIAGAGLDVFEKEPLPEDSELWGMDNVVVSPHMGGIAPETRDESFEIFLENFEKFVTGKPLRNVIDKARQF
ncbi:D-2-hydroxyacid dehydrogenase [Candidatus Poribacteria bacterium]|nr:D-2-hydroxyacid dehydrogenase [Candidatus Poribacteria bacterium]